MVKESLNRKERRRQWVSRRENGCRESRKASSEGQYSSFCLNVFPHSVSSPIIFCPNTPEQLSSPKELIHEENNRCQLFSSYCIY
ncbi:MAG: hypothetical protein M3Q06_01485, partial [Bacteroidota bacterium]|nr:hypothetical protein [Bacteroidota bacterium]